MLCALLAPSLTGCSVFHWSEVDTDAADTGTLPSGDPTPTPTRRRKKKTPPTPRSGPTMRPAAKTSLPRHRSSTAPSTKGPTLLPPRLRCPIVAPRSPSGRRPTTPSL